MISKFRSTLLPLAAIAAAAAFPVFAQDAAMPSAPEQAASAEPASPAPAEIPAPAEPAPAPAPAPVPAPAARPPVVPGKVEAPQEGKGQIVFFRRGGQPGMALSFSIRENGEGVAKLSSGSYVVVPVEPGAHTYMIESEAADTLTLEIDPDETYFVEQTMRMGIIMGRPQLLLSTQAFFQSKPMKLSAAVPTDKKSAAKAK